MHYVRHKGKSIMASRDTYLLMKKWKSHLMNVWQFRFYFWSQPGRIHINDYPIIPSISRAIFQVYN
ncbi:hypothetical protein AMTRI_Chr02g264750 [Amborella trichopoda]